MEICAICFEPTQAADLPCECRASYCEDCLDKALLASIEKASVPRCPTCRASFVLEADPATGALRLVKYGSGVDPELDKLAWPVVAWENRREAQLKLFKDHSRQHGSCPRGRRSSASSSRDGAAAVPPPPQKGGSPAGAEAMDCVPLCVCGASFEFVDKRIRVRGQMDDLKPGWREAEDAEELLREFLERAEVRCDLCSRPCAVWFWSCARKRLAHPDGLDVCPSCYEDHCGKPAAPARRRSLFCAACFPRGLGRCMGACLQAD